MFDDNVVNSAKAVLQIQTRNFFGILQEFLQVFNSKWFSSLKSSFSPKFLQRIYEILLIIYFFRKLIWNFTTVYF